MTFKIEVRDLALVHHNYTVRADSVREAVHKVRQMHATSGLPMVRDVVRCVPTEPTEPVESQVDDKTN